MNPARRWVAVVLSLLMAGLGHVYIGRPMRAILVLACVELLGPILAVILLVAGTTLPILIASAGVAVAIVALIAWDAGRLARGGRRRFHSGRAVFAACTGFLVGAVLVGEVSAAARDRLIAKAYRVPSEAMIPTLFPGDHFVADAMSLHRQPIARGDVIVFKVAREGSKVFPVDERPDLPQDLFVKRVVGIAGDEIELGSHGLLVNDSAVQQIDVDGFISDSRGHELKLREESLDGRQYRTSVAPLRSSSQFGPVRIPEGRYFVLGDNRDYSNDSRYWGTIRREDIVGRARTIYWSWEYDGSPAELLNLSALQESPLRRARWDRIGMRVR